MSKLWIGNKLYSVENEVRDYFDELEANVAEYTEMAAKAYTACSNYQQRIKDLEALRDTVAISCNPPDDCNDPVVLKIYMKACFDEAEKLF